jgi:hypothetical protein
MLRHFRATASDEKVEVATFIGLKNVLDVQLAITRFILGNLALRRVPRIEARADFIVADVDA